jgi:hypothetical protein
MREAYRLPAAGAGTATSCLYVLFDEEWAHRRYAVRDLTAIKAQQ